MIFSWIDLTGGNPESLISLGRFHAVVNEGLFIRWRFSIGRTLFKAETPSSACFCGEKL
jgi:hypothetical protein